MGTEVKASMFLCTKASLARRDRERERERDERERDERERERGEREGEERYLNYFPK